MADIASSDPIPPFYATVDNVAALVGNVNLLTSAPVPGSPNTGITVATVAGWIQELSDTVVLYLDGWERLNGLLPDTDEEAAETDPNLADDTLVDIMSDLVSLERALPGTDLAQFIRVARNVVQNGAASYLQAARYPAQAGANTDSYANVLWARYQTGLSALAVWLTRRLEGLDAAERPDGNLEPVGVTGAFPAPTMVDQIPVWPGFYSGRY